MLPHSKEEKPIYLDITITDNNSINVNIDILEKKYLSKRKMKIFHAPLRPIPSTLIKMNINDYVVSIKPDGIFTALYIGGDGNGYYLYPRTRRLYKIGYIENPLYRNIICSGELMNYDIFGNKIKPYLILFDILEYGNNNLSDDLSERLLICNDIIKNFKLTNVFNYIIIKSYVPIKSIYRIISSKLHRKDGIIFTLKKGKPGYNCIRWKPYPTITVGFEYIKKHHDYVAYFSDTNHKKQFKKRYYNFYERDYVNNKNNSTFLFGDILYQIDNSDYDLFYNKYAEFFGKDWVEGDDLFIEFFVSKDPFYLHDKGDFSIMRFRDDKNYPDNIKDVNDILNLMYNPIRLDEILGKKSIYNYWIPPSKKTDDWTKYSKKIKRIIYNRWSNPGRVLDICAGRGSDTMLLYLLSKNKKFSEICCLEKDNMQTEALYDFTNMIRSNNIIGMDCKINIKKGDMNDTNILNYYQNKFDTIICSNAIQFAFDPYETQYGLNNIKKLLKLNGILIIVFMDGKKLKKSSNNNCNINNNGGICRIHSNEDPIIFDPSTNDNYNYCDNKNCTVDPVNIFTNNVGLFYKYSCDNRSHINVKLPTSISAVKEPIVDSDNLVFQLMNLGFQLVELKDFNSIKRYDNDLSSLYSYAIFKYVSYYEKPSMFLSLCNDVFFKMLGFLDVIDIFSLGQVHRIFTDKCFIYMKIKPLEWKRFYKETKENECEDISYWT